MWNDWTYVSDRYPICVINVTKFWTCAHHLIDILLVHFLQLICLRLWTLLSTIYPNNSYNAYFGVVFWMLLYHSMVDTCYNNSIWKRDPGYWHGLSGITKYIHGFMWDLIIYLWLSSKGSSTDPPLMFHYTIHKTMDVIPCTCPYLSAVLSHIF